MAVSKAVKKAARKTETASDVDVKPSLLARMRGNAEPVKLSKAGGRPMLGWVGKRALSSVQAFPAQLVERYGEEASAGEQWVDWPDGLPRGGLLYHGDNKEVLAHLLANGFRGKVKLIYIDPPFDSGADYVRKVELRGPKGAVKLEGESYTLGEQIQYTDIWANDNYLQFMYERLMLLKELLAKDGVIYLHCDETKHHHLRFLMDEVFGSSTFRNEIVWWYWNKMQGNINRFASNHDTILCYAKGSAFYKKIKVERPDVVRQLARRWDAKTGSIVNARDDEGNLIYIESDEKTLDDVWMIPMLQPADKSENVHYPTQKREELLAAIIESSSHVGDIVLDCFIGSGTTAAVAQKLGRRWVGCDINKGAIQTTGKRLQSIIAKQIEALIPQGLPFPSEEGVAPAQFGFTHWRVNDYDLAIQHNEAVALACEHLGVERTKNDTFFDGLLGKQLVKIAPFAHPLSAHDLETIRKELEARPDEDRDIVVVGLGKELAADAWLENWNRLRKQGQAANRIDLIELRTHPKYGQFFQHEAATAKVKVKRAKGKLHITIEDFASPVILQRLANQTGVVKPHIKDWRSMVDSVMIDATYDDATFKVQLADVPVRKTDFVNGDYTLNAPEGETTVAVKITDMLGEEVLVVQTRA